MTRIVAVNRLREHRQRLGLSSVHVAELVGTSPQTVCRLEMGNMTLSLAWINRFAEALQVKPSDILPTAEVEPDKDSIIASLREQIHHLNTRLLLRERKIAELERRLTLIHDQAEIWGEDD
jgi:transcriptional regulator with XRE-family HTH domain